MNKHHYIQFLSKDNHTRIIQYIEEIVTDKLPLKGSKVKHALWLYNVNKRDLFQGYYLCSRGDYKNHLYQQTYITPQNN